MFVNVNLVMKLMIALQISMSACLINAKIQQNALMELPIIHANVKLDGKAHCK